MDIRSFFGAKKPAAKSKKPNAGTTSSSNKKSTATATTRAQSTADATAARVKRKSETSNAPPKAPPSSSATTAKRRRIQVMLESSEEEKDDDSDTTTCAVEETIHKKKYAKKRVVRKQTAKKRSTEVDVDADSDATTYSVEEQIPKKQNKGKQTTKNSENSNGATKNLPSTRRSTRNGAAASAKKENAREEVSPEDFFTNTQDKPKKKKKMAVVQTPPSSSSSDNNSDSDEFMPSANNNDDDDDEGNFDSDDDEVSPPSKFKKNRTPSTPSSAVRKRGRSPDTTSPTSSSSKHPTSLRKAATSKAPKSTPRAPKSTPVPKAPKHKPLTPIPPFPTSLSTDDIPSECLLSVTFVFTGNMADLPRDDAEDMVKVLGGRVTKAVSGKTDYLVCGDILEDGREVHEGSKHKRATELGEDSVKIIKGEGEFYKLLQMIGGNISHTSATKKEEKEEKKVASSPAVIVKNPYAKKSPASAIKNPYVKASPVVNPYARKSNPYNTPSSSSSSTSKTTTSDVNSQNGGRAIVKDSNALWADKYAPSSSKFILGNAESVRKLTIWLSKWEATTSRSKSPIGKAALLSGPPGIGKTTTAVLVAREAGREVLEWNASDVRSKKSLAGSLGDVTGSQVLQFGSKNNSKRSTNSKKRCIIMDEVDGMGAGDRSGMAELIKMIKLTKVPIICICNDRQSQKVRSLVPYCLDLRYRRPVKTVIARRAVEIGNLEGMRVEINAAEAVAESCGNDIRQVLNCLQMWSSSNRDKKTCMTYKDLKDRQSDINKDEILRVSMFDSTRMIVEGAKGTRSSEEDWKAANKSLYSRCDAFFTDYSLMGLNVHQNYLKVMVSQYQETKRSGNADSESAVIERMHEATLSMSDFAFAENLVRGGDQLWQLLPLCSVLAVKAGHHASGNNGSFLPGYPEFAGWLGKNSTRGKKDRILQELNHHMNFRISGDNTSLRLRYLPMMREKFMTMLNDEGNNNVSEVIELMDEYGLDRDDLFENIDEFTLDQKAFKFNSLDSKAKAAFTREYNKGVHRSQALVAEEVGGKGARGRKQSSNDDGLIDPDAIDDDKLAAAENSEDETDDLDAIQKMFKTKKKGRAKTAKKSAPKRKKK